MTNELKIRNLNFENNFSKKDLLNSDFILYHQDNLKIYYAPFDFINLQAKIIFVGITPGWTQMKKSFEVVKLALDENKDWSAAIQEVKQQASFAGTMRKNLISMLDEIGLNTKLKLNTCGELYTTHNSIIHATSFLKNPVFYQDKNYRGKTPSPTKNHLWQIVCENFRNEINQFNNVLIIPLGTSVKEVLSKLREEKLINENNIILNQFPHPSGANGHRLKQFTEYKEFLKNQIENWQY